MVTTFQDNHEDRKDYNNFKFCYSLCHKQIMGIEVPTM